MIPWVRLAILGTIAVVPAGIVWSWRDSVAEVEKREAVESAVVQKVGEIRTAMEEEGKARAAFQKEVNRALSGLAQDVKRVQRERAGTSADIAKDIADNAAFYQQPIPDLGRTAWLRARSAAAPASSASSPP